MRAGSQLHQVAHLAALYRCRSVKVTRLCRLHPPSTCIKVQSLRFHHGSSMGRIFLKFGHKTPGASFRHQRQKFSLGDAAVSSGGHSIRHESTTIALRGWKEDLSPADSRNLALTSQVLFGSGCSQGQSGSPCFINSTLRRFFGHRHQRV